MARAIRNAIRANQVSRESFAIETPIFIARQADSHESLEFPIRENHPIRTNRANRFARITPLSASFSRTGTGKHINKIFTGLSRDYPGTVPAFSSDFLGILFMCFPFSPGKRETHKQFDPHPFPGQSREVVYVYWFFCPPIIKEAAPHKIN